MHNIPVAFIIIVVVALFFKTFMNRSMKNYNPNEEFWEKEKKADRTPRKPVDDLPYITVDKDSLPLDIPCRKAEAEELQDNIRMLSEKKILNFTGISNTDLKLTYGAPNIAFLTACDLNYTRLVQNVAKLAELYIKEGYTAEAKTLLEYGISVGTDVKKNYTLLAKIYVEDGQKEKIPEMIETAKTLNSLSKNGIIAHLEKMM